MRYKLIGNADISGYFSSLQPLPKRLPKFSCTMIRYSEILYGKSYVVQVEIKNNGTIIFPNVYYNGSFPKFNQFYVVRGDHTK